MVRDQVSFTISTKQEGRIPFILNSITCSSGTAVLKMLPVLH